MGVTVTLWTVGALVRPLSSVDSLVGLEVARVHEVLLAPTALVLLVGRLVLLKHFPAGEPTAARTAN